MTEERYIDPHMSGPHSHLLGKIILDKTIQRSDTERTNLTAALEWYSKTYYQSEKKEE